MNCSFCGNQADDTANFCVACGNNLKASSQYYNKSSVQQQQTQNNVQYQPVDFVVQQKFLTLRAVYRIKNAQGNDVMVAKRPFFNFIRPKLAVKSMDGKKIGKIQGNLFRSKWKLVDDNGNVHAVIHMPALMFFRKHFTLKTNAGDFKSGDSFVAYNWSCYDSNGQVSFQIDKKVLALRDSFKIQSFGILSPFITTMAAVCIDQRFFSKKSFSDLV